ncbi:hypothetical protein IMCC3135_13815 [Granulosicoccus antarcticus IMCC3135]|uniref:Uncharacterized protein n=1 Tax=Granulosicoccus antarcticus IMCC3135 TaxID=1192854 RepID=A0A2Z2NSY6_9GAMM|nr:hypothetical protein IMCC3135_13815 [Granulosicoccus antarcticus IMCC3135]
MSLQSNGLVQPMSGLIKFFNVRVYQVELSYDDEQ